jgi:hypothetical protein
MLNGNSQTDFMLVYRDHENRPKFAKAKTAKANHYANWSWDTIRGRAKRNVGIRFLSFQCRRKDRVGLTHQFVSKLRRRFVELGILEKTALHVTNRTAARFRWLLPQSKARPVLMTNHIALDSVSQSKPNEQSKPKRKSAPGIRHRKDNGPQELEVTPVPPPSARQLGTLTRYTREIIEGGPRALIAAEHTAGKLAKKFGIELEAQWCLSTPYLEQLSKSENAKAARYALQWRPRYLAVLSLSRSDIFACRAAKVGRSTPVRHREQDPIFNEQCLKAEQHAIELLHDVTMQSAIEGECEPVFWQGIEVGHIRKIDNRLRIEMLRAHMPKTFKTPGSKVAINTGTITNNTMVVDAAERDRLIGLRRESLQRMHEKKLAAVTAQAS